MSQNDVAVFVTALLLVLLIGRAIELKALLKKDGKARKPRRLRPRTPEDCPYCGEEHESKCHPVVRFRRQPIPYKERKSRRGRPKEKQTEGHCCWNLACEYYGIATLIFTP